MTAGIETRDDLAAELEEAGMLPEPNQSFANTELGASQVHTANGVEIRANRAAVTPSLLIKEIDENPNSTPFGQLAAALNIAGPDVNTPALNASPSFELNKGLGAL